MAIAWTRAGSHAVHPIIGARDVRQLEDNLGAVDVVLPGEAAQRLVDAVEFTVGFPTDFIAAGERNPGVVGGNSTELDGR